MNEIHIFSDVLFAAAGVIFLVEAVTKKSLTSAALCLVAAGLLLAPWGFAG